MTDRDPADLPSAETACIGVCFLEAEAASLVLAHLKPDHFVSPEARTVFRVLQRETPEGGTPDTVLVFEELRSDPTSNGAVAFAVEAMKWPTAANARSYVKIVLDAWATRQEIAGHQHAASEAEETRAYGAKLLADAAAARAKIDADLAPTKATDLFVPTGAFDLLQKPMPMIEELVTPRIIYRGGVTFLVASHKRGKSLAGLGLSTDLVLNISTPLEQRIGPSAPTWLGQAIIGSGPVVVYSAEGGERMIQERIRVMVPHAGDWLNDLRVYASKPTPRLDDPAHLDAIFAHAEAVGAVLIVFDPLGRFWAMDDEADATTARNLMEAIQVRAEAACGGRGIAVLIIHHDTKATGSDGDSAVTGGRGSGKFGDDADAIINLKLDGKGSTASQSKAMFLLRHAESPAPVHVTIDKKTLRLREVGEQELAEAEAHKPKTGRTPKLSLEAIETLVRRKGRVEIKRIPDELNVALGTWNNVRKALMRDITESAEFVLEVVGKVEFLVHKPTEFK